MSQITRSIRLSTWICIVGLFTLAACGAPTPTTTNDPNAAETAGALARELTATQNAAASNTQITPQPIQAETTPQSTPTIMIPPSITPVEATAVPAENATAAPATGPAVAETAVVDTPAPPQPPTAGNLTTPRVLAWDPNTAMLSWYQAAGDTVEMDDTGLSRPLAYPCAEAANYLVVHIGSDSSGRQLAIPFDGGPGVLLAENNGLACSITGGVQFSSDNTLVGVLRLDADASRAAFTAGDLEISAFPAFPKVTPRYTVGSVTAYTLSNDGALLLQFYANTQGNAGEADLVWWDAATGEPRAIQRQILPLEGCYFTSGRVLRQGDRVYTLLGERCTSRGSSWRLIAYDFAGGNAENVRDGQAGGAYFVYAGTNAIFAMPNGESLITFPNGLNLDIANVFRLPLTGGAVKPVLIGAVVDQHPPSMPRRFLFNPARDRLAMITRDGNGGETLYLYDLTNPEREAVQIAGGKRSDRIGGLAWMFDGTRLYYLLAGDTNALFYFSLAGASENKLVVRSASGGIFQGLAISPDGKLAATSEQNKVADNDMRNNLILIDVERESKTTLLEGKRGESALQPFAVR